MRSAGLKMYFTFSLPLCLLIFITSNSAIKPALRIASVVERFYFISSIGTLAFEFEIKTA